MINLPIDEGVEIERGLGKNTMYYSPGLCHWLENYTTLYQGIYFVFYFISTSILYVFSIDTGIILLSKYTISQVKSIDFSPFIFPM